MVSRRVGAKLCLALLRRGTPVRSLRRHCAPPRWPTDPETDTEWATGSLLELPPATDCEPSGFALGSPLVWRTGFRPPSLTVLSIPGSLCDDLGLALDVVAHDEEIATSPLEKVGLHGGGNLLGGNAEQGQELTIVVVAAARDDAALLELRGIRVDPKPCPKSCRGRHRRRRHREECAHDRCEPHPAPLSCAATPSGTPSRRTRSSSSRRTRRRRPT
jgi:hypothetical protein